MQIVLVVVAVLIATFWPRAGQATALLPMGTTHASSSINWASREGAMLQSIEAGGVIVIAGLPSTESALRAIKAGLLPIAAVPALCSASPKERAETDG
ncbi:hypothetical protein ACRAQ6_01785 [Erythrobacter sp. HA6-11]